MAPEVVREGSPSSGFEDAMGALSFVLAKIAEFPLAIDHLGLEGVRDLALKWRSHFESVRKTDRGAQWERFQSFFSALREGEQTYVRRRTRDLRETAALVLRSLRDTIQTESAGDERVSRVIDGLRSALDGDSHVQLHERAAEAINAMDDFLAAMRARHRTQAAELQRLRARLGAPERDGELDSTTGLLTEADFTHHLESWGTLANLCSQPMALLLVEIDGWEEWVAHHGQLAAECALRRVADAARSRFGGAGDLLARHGAAGVAILADVSGSALGYERAQELLRAIRALEIAHGPARFRVTSSMGLALLRRGETPDAWLARARGALAKARQSGCDRVVMLAA